MPGQPILEIQNMLEGTGIALNGSNPWDPQIHDQRFYSRIINEGTLGFGESYMDGWWDCDKLDELVHRLMRQDVKARLGLNLPLAMEVLKNRLFNSQSKSRAFVVGKEHYDIGNELYEAMLDKRTTHSCAYWKDARDLDQAQEAKLDLICRKINLQPGQRILDIGCGWGGLAKYAAEKFGVSVVGITVSEKQIWLGRQICAGLPIELRLQDYRDLDEKFDHIVSVGMFEHVGYRNYRTYFEVARRCLSDRGLFLLHTIGGNQSVTGTDPWMEKYIFPNSMLPSAAQLTKAMEGYFVLEDWHNFGSDYDKTLMAWHENFQNNWPKLKGIYDERFRRKWKFYLLSCAGTFRARINQLWQLVLTKNGVPGGYSPVR